jgi:hypothetical protein
LSLLKVSIENIPAGFGLAAAQLRACQMIC